MGVFHLFVMQFAMQKIQFVCFFAAAATDVALYGAMLTMVFRDFFNDGRRTFWTILTMVCFAFFAIAECGDHFHGIVSLFLHVGAAPMFTLLSEFNF